MKRLFLTAGILLCTGLFVLPAAAQDQAKQEPAAEKDLAIDPAAKELLSSMTDRLAGAERLSVKIRAGYDAVQESGQKIEFGENRTMFLARPDRLHSESQLSDGGKRLVVFDGNTISVLDADENVYAQVEKPGSVDDAIRYLVGDLRVRIPLARMFLTSLSADMAGRLQSLSLVEDNVLTDDPIAHLAGRTEDVDVQVWIPRKGEPLPRRIVISYKHDEGEPQFRADFSDWNLNPEASDSQFTFSPPSGAEKIPFLIRVRKQDTAAEQTGGKQ